MLQGVDKFVCVGGGVVSKRTCWYLALAFRMGGREGRQKGEGE